MKKSYFKLDENAPLFNALSMKPLWWCELLKDGDLYCNIRKNNRVNVYYRGASIMSLSCKDKKIEAEIHNYYLGFEKDMCSKLGIAYGNIKLTPEEILCRMPSIKKRVEANKKNQACFDGDERNGKNYSSEKFIQSRMFLDEKSYVDTEFALSLDDGTEIRIDMVKLSNNGEICFEELKLVDDARLKPSGKKPAEILIQMDNYSKFLKEAAKLKGDNSVPIIVEYYTKVVTIMKKIGILRTDIVPKSVCDYVFLQIEQIYTRAHIRRDESIKTIQKVCEGLHSSIEEVVKSYNSL